MTTVFVVLGATVLCVAGGGVWQNKYGDVATAEVGDCVEMTSTNVKSGIDLEDCSSQDANYRVALRLGPSASGCPSGDYRMYRGKDYGFARRPRLCLTLNAGTGECVTGLDGFPRKVPCAGASAKVTSVADKYGNACGTGEKRLSYASPAATICLGKP